MNGAPSLDIKFSIATPIANTTYQEFVTIANSTSSGLSGGAWSGDEVSGVSTISAWNSYITEHNPFTEWNKRVCWNQSFNTELHTGCYQHQHHS